MIPTPSTAPLHAVNDNASQACEPIFDHPTMHDHPVTRTAFAEGMARLQGRRSLIESTPLDQIEAGDPTLGDPAEILADFRADRI